jgi:copper chaperone
MKTTLLIQNLKCHGCANTITTKLSAIAGLGEVTVNVEEDTVSFDYVNDAALAEAKTTLHSLGYPEAGDDNNLLDKAKSYASCAIGRLS